MTEFGRAVWVLAAKRGITSMRESARRITAVSGERVHHDTLRNYLQGRTAVPVRFLKLLDAGLKLTADEKRDLAQIFVWGETIGEG